MTEDSNNLLPLKLETAPDSPTKPVKSTAVVKYSAVPNPATFAQLQCNTDLNLPPSNWLSTSAESYGLQNVWSRNTGFSSFRMAHMFPDCVGEVDVVSDAENIKKLLKLPYSGDSISMVVHRIENTLLLDDFDVRKYLLRQAECDWKWLRKFFYDQIFQNLGDKEKRLFPKANSRNAIQQKNLISKFFYHSLVLEDDKEPNDAKPPFPVETLQSTLPEPSQEEKLPDPNSSHKFARNVVWTFENIQMLIGTDMPIFGGETHPCISLRLCDAKKPINVLTGIDYWLDNLMCNVPEVAMCYHIEGIVQKYESIKTEDLPNIDNAKFSPKVIRDIAQNILSFLKSNATKAGHTYWLFKGKNDDVIKLYDLTSLCDMSEDKSQNPFTVPVAMLLYRVARNMKYSSDYKKYQGTIRMLLKNCIQLLPKEKYPQIVTSAHYMLADLYIPADTDPANPNLVDQGDEDDAHIELDSNAESEKSDEKFEQDMSAAIKSLTLTKIKEHHLKDQKFEEFKFKPPPISGTVEERCQIALEHISIGLDCLKYFPKKSKDQKSQTEEQDKGNTEKEKPLDEEKVNMAKPFQAIPLPYAPLKPKTDSPLPESLTADSSANSSPSNKKGKKSKKKKNSEKLPVKNPPSNKTVVEDTTAKALLCKTQSQTLPTWQAPKKDDNQSWGSHLKILLYEKASLVFVVLAEREYSNENYGSSLRYILSVLRCQRNLQVFCKVRNSKFIGCLLGRAGDCCFMTVQNWADVEKHKKDYETKTRTEIMITNSIFAMEGADMNDAEVLQKGFDSLEVTLMASCKCYEKALYLEPSKVEKNNLLRRLGNIHNELGVLYMNQAGCKLYLFTRFQNDETVDPNCLSIKIPLLRSEQHLEAGVKAFELVGDKANLALLYSNTGRLMRLNAYVHRIQSKKEKDYYIKAVSNYQKALEDLETRESNPPIWDTVIWELSSTYFNMASLLQDYPPVDTTNEEELQREVCEIFQKALKYCNIETPGPRQPIYQFRAAAIQHRLASLYHRIYWKLNNEADNSKRKNTLQLTKRYYEKSAKIFLALEQTIEFLRVQMERVALAEGQAEASNAFHVKLKAYKNALELILQSRPIIKNIIERNRSIVNKQKYITKQEEVDKQNQVDNSIENEKMISDEKKQITEEQKIIVLLEHRLQLILLSLTKLYANKSSANQKKEGDRTVAFYKKCYSLALRSKKISGIELIKHIANVLENLEKTMQESKDS
ncbi:hypothetical protein TSAR_004336 [Trichomalopsis sarcophagae]|uniref:Erythroid differentiation-related factor 1 n=1 Tax=Trichomalopsis sarcophagae TaxID=543379 RepID=A0A232FNK2_9HYME|nr:hypothetical protein TSAR_004336 [Trichomalopsis sarcophagae]